MRSVPALPMVTARGLRLLIPLSRFLLLIPPSAPSLLVGVRRLSGVRKRAVI